MCVRVCAHQSNWPDASTVLARPLPSAVVPFIGHHCHVTRTSSIRFVTWHLCRYFALITPTHYNGHWRKIDFEGEWCSPASTNGTMSKCYYDCIANVDLLCCCCLQHRRHTHTHTLYFVLLFPMVPHWRSWSNHQFGDKLHKKAPPFITSRKNLRRLCSLTTLPY